MLKKLSAIAIAAALTAAMFAGCSAPAANNEPGVTPTETVNEAPSEPTATPAEPTTRTIIDHDGDEIVIPAKIERVAVSGIWPLSAFITMYLGSADKIIAIAPAPMAAAQNGVIGKVFPNYLNAATDWIQNDEINVEEMMKLKPDVVFCSAGGTDKAVIQAAGIPAIAVSATKWDYDCIVTFDKWVEILEQVFPGEAHVDGVSEYSKRVYDEVQAVVKDIPDEERPRAMFLFQYTDSVMITSGKYFFGQYWISAGGGVNVAEGMSEKGSNAVINMEQVYEWNPEVIYITNFTPAQPDDLYNNAIGGDDWSKVEAVKNNRVYKMPLGAYRSYTPGIDTPLTLKWMAKTLYTELFADVDMTQEVKDYYSQYFGVTLTDDDVNAMFTPSSAAGTYR
ncbi:MAG: ABC transporter substrate-binding protein [Oscillospiraceae bacterium]|jgi:iron complex transport system substrate-binding protein|nr:ABC transporter substrate-binding protein [Oscillospiraceae bacterium]